MLRVATKELVRLAEQVALWKALGSDTALHERLDASYVGAVACTVLFALQNAIVLGLARMFDEDSRALDTSRLLNAVAKPGNTAWLRERHEAHFRTPLSTLFRSGGMSEAEQAALRRTAQETSATGAGEEFDRRMQSFLIAKKDFRRGEVCDALQRLKEMRNKEVAHTEMQPEWRTPRPMAGDIDVVFGAVRELVWNANVLCTGTHHAELHDLSIADAMARCFTAVLRPESDHERRAASQAALDQSIDLR